MDKEDKMNKSQEEEKKKLIRKNLYHTKAEALEVRYSTQKSSDQFVDEKLFYTSYELKKLMNVVISNDNLTQEKKKKILNGYKEAHKNVYAATFGVDTSIKEACKMLSGMKLVEPQFPSKLVKYFEVDGGKGEGEQADVNDEEKEQCGRDSPEEEGEGAAGGDENIPVPCPSSSCKAAPKKKKPSKETWV